MVQQIQCVTAAWRCPGGERGGGKDSAFLGQESNNMAVVMETQIRFFKESCEPQIDDLTS